MTEIAAAGDYPSGERRCSLLSSFSRLNHVGPETERRLSKLAGDHRLIDLLFHGPNQSRMRLFIEDISQAPPETPVTFIATVYEHAPPYRRGRAPYRIALRDEKDQPFHVIIFRGAADWLTKTYPVGQRIVLSGLVKAYNNSYQMTHPDFAGPVNKASQWTGPETIYPLTEGISLSRLKYWLGQSFERLEQATPLPEWWDDAALSLTKAPSFDQALRCLHHTDQDQWEKGKYRLSMDELFVQQILMGLSRHLYKKSDAPILSVNPDIRERFLNLLPFALTSAQERSLMDIDGDMGQKTPMLRLLQGDVGSGKTIVGFCALLNGIGQGVQGAFLAPTEILARQHYQDLLPYCDALGYRGALLIGSLSAAEKRRLYKELENGEIHLVIGTHALIQEAVSFQKLGIVVVDEQHRFGVEQRLQLTSKGISPHILAMSATPIPRSLALTLHGDLDLSVLDEKPPGRQPIQTTLLSLSRLDALIARLNKALEGPAQAYWVCPLIEVSDLQALAAAEERFAHLQKTLGHPVALLHGRLKSAEKQRIMDEFSAGKIKVLVSTTVIEVGVNVPQASIMIIDHGERFGLSQLHQLRGRVGRGAQQSFCVMTHALHLSQNAQERLQAMVDHDDGFKLAEIDLKLRGAGELIGQRQSGHMSYRFADPFMQQDLVRLAHQQARDLLAHDPQLLSDRGRAARFAMQLFGKEDAHKTLMSG